MQARQGKDFRDAWNDLVVDVSKRSDKRNATQVMVTGTYGGTRLQERKVVQIVCA